MIPELSVHLVALTLALSWFGGPPVPARSSPWSPPLDGTIGVAQPFEPPGEPWLAGHRGVDLEAGVGEVVRAAGAGTVTWAAPVAGRGVVVIEHEDGRRTTYEPLEPAVLVGEMVTAGDPVGVIAAGAGHCGGVPACLHWGLRRDSAYLDPMLLLRAGRPVLLP